MKEGDKALKAISKKNEVLQIGITGGIGTGKSTICRIFQMMGIAVYDADTRAKLVMHTDEQLKTDLKNAFGKEVYISQNEKEIVNRDFLLQKVFKDKEKVELLNSIVHPAVGRDYFNWKEENKTKSPYLLKEAALMFESNSYKVLDAVVAVTAPLEERIVRVLERDPHRSEAQVRAIIDKQMPEKQKTELADFVIYNDHSHSIIKQVLRLHGYFFKVS